MRIDLYVHFGIAAPQTAILDKLDAILKQGAQIMSTVADAKQLIADIDVETTAIAAKIDQETQQIAALQAQLAAGTPVTQSDLDGIVSGLSPISDRLKTLGADPAQPIPPPAS